MEEKFQEKESLLKELWLVFLTLPGVVGEILREWATFLAALLQFRVPKVLSGDARHSKSHHFVPVHNFPHSNHSQSTPKNNNIYDNHHSNNNIRSNTHSDSHGNNNNNNTHGSSSTHHHGGRNGITSGSIPRSPAPCRLRKTLILDLDETLVHSTFQRTHNQREPSFSSKSRLAAPSPHPCEPDSPSPSLFGNILSVFGSQKGSQRIPREDERLRVHVVLNSVPCTFQVRRRPHVETFLAVVARWYECVIFTASLRKYADPVIDNLDSGRGALRRRYFRESCVQRNGCFVKDLSRIGQAPEHTIIVDNSPGAYQSDRDNAVPIESWFDDPRDEALLDLLPLLDALRFVHDVRSVLSRKDRFVRQRSRHSLPSSSSMGNSSNSSSYASMGPGGDRSGQGIGVGGTHASSLNISGGGGHANSLHRR